MFQFGSRQDSRLSEDLERIYIDMSGPTRSPSGDSSSGFRWDHVSSASQPSPDADHSSDTSGSLATEEGGAGGQAGVQHYHVYNDKFLFRNQHYHVTNVHKSKYKHVHHHHHSHYHIHHPVEQGSLGQKIVPMGSTVATMPEHQSQLAVMQVAERDFGRIESQAEASTGFPQIQPVLSDQGKRGMENPVQADNHDDILETPPAKMRRMNAFIMGEKSRTPDANKKGGQKSGMSDP